MDDDVLSLTRNCAEALGRIWDDDAIKGPNWIQSRDGTNANQFDYMPASDPAQAFELLCWRFMRFVFGWCYFPKCECRLYAGEQKCREGLMP